MRYAETTAVEPPPIEQPAFPAAAKSCADVVVCWKGDIASLISSPPGAAASSPRPDSIWSRSSCPEVRGSYSVDRLSAAGAATSASCCCPDGRRGALQLVEGAEAEAKHNPTGLTKLADQAGTVRRVRARAGRLAVLGAAK